MGSIQLRGEQSGTSVLHRVLKSAVEAYADQLGTAFPEDPRQFRKTYPNVLPVFETARLASPDRHAIARLLAARMQSELVWGSDTSGMPLGEALLESKRPLPLRTALASGDPAGWNASVDYGERQWSLDQLGELGNMLCDRNVISAAAARSLEWLAAHHTDTIDLRDRKIVVLGASAEMASTRYFLEAGANVLWIDVVPPAPDLLDNLPGGQLSWPESGADLLTQPGEILATIQAFADDDAVDLALYAYAPGQAREVRLTGAMNALVNALPVELIKSVTVLVSPTTPTELTAVDLDAMASRLGDRPAWEALLAFLRIVGDDGAARIGDAAATRTVVSIQGASYQAAQYLGKVLMAECWATHGSPANETASPLRVSANTAAITKTRSLNHPVFDAAFGGAAAFGVETFSPEQSQQVNGLLAIKDWLDPETPIPGRVRVHGGIHTLPYPLESAMLSAAAIGFARKPALLTGLLRG